MSLRLRAVRVEDELWDAAKAKAQASNETLSAIIRQTLIEYIKPGEN